MQTPHAPSAFKAAMSALYLRRSLLWADKLVLYRVIGSSAHRNIGSSVSKPKRRKSTTCRDPAIPENINSDVHLQSEEEGLHRPQNHSQPRRCLK